MQNNQSKRPSFLSTLGTKTLSMLGGVSSLVTIGVATSKTAADWLNGSVVVVFGMIAIFSFLLAILSWRTKTGRAQKRHDTTDDRPLETKDRDFYQAWIWRVTETYEFDRWNMWTYKVLSTEPSISRQQAGSIEVLTLETLAGIFPGSLPRLEASMKTLIRAGHEFVQHFKDNLGNKESEDYIIPWDFHRIGNPQNDFEKNDLMAKGNAWKRRADLWIYYLTRCANWFADEVRTSIDPSFFSEGKFVIADPDGNVDWEPNFRLVEFTEEEKAQILKTKKGDLPESLKKLMRK